MNFKWDPRKATANFSKHGVRFADAVAVFTDPQALTIEDLGRGEERYVTLGMGRTHASPRGGLHLAR